LIVSWIIVCNDVISDSQHIPTTATEATKLDSVVYRRTIPTDRKSSTNTYIRPDSYIDIIFNS